MAQRVWTMLWLAGGLFPFIIDLVCDYAKTRLGNRNIIDLVCLVITFTLITPAVGGFVVVGEMLREYGTCAIFS